MSATLAWSVHRVGAPSRASMGLGLAPYPRRHVSLAAADRADALMSRFGSMRASFMDANNASLILPVLPGTVFEHTIAARPNFDNRRKPQRNFMFIIQWSHAPGIIAGSILESQISL